MWFELDSPSDELCLPDALMPDLSARRSEGYDEIDGKALRALEQIGHRFRFIVCRRGVHQGCPFGSLLFCRGVRGVVRRVLAAHPSVRIPSIADDMTLVGPQFDCACAFLDLKHELKTVGLEVSEPKCKAFCSSSIHPEVRRLLVAWGGLVETHDEKTTSFPSGGFILCGAPVGPEPEWSVTTENRFEAEEVVRAVEKRARAVSRVAQVKDPVSRHLLSRYCISTRYNHQVRTVDPVTVMRGAALHEKQVEGLLASCLDLDQEDASVPGPVQWALRQAKMPNRHGGMGAVPALDVRHSAYYGSYMLVMHLVRDLFSDVGVDSQPQRDVVFGPETTAETTEDFLLARNNGELPKSFVTCYTKYGTWFDALKVALDSVGENVTPAELRADIPTPILHCILAREHVINVAAQHGIKSSKCKPFSDEPLPVLPLLDFSTPQLKAQRLASEIMKKAEFLKLRSEARSAGALDVVSRLDDCSAFGGGAFLEAIPLGRDRTGRFVMQADHWVVAARHHFGLPPSGVEPSTLCCSCGQRWDYGSAAGSVSRASIHPHCCAKRGTIQGRRHDSICDVLMDMWKALGGTCAADHKKELSRSGTNLIGSECALPSGNRVDVILFGAGTKGADIAIDVSVVCTEAYCPLSFKEAIKKRRR